MSDFLGDHPQLLKVNQAVHAGVIAWGRKKNESCRVKEQSDKFLLTQSVVDLSAEKLHDLVAIC